MPILTAKTFNAPVELELPSMKGSGNTVLLRKPDMYALIDGSGKVSDPLTNMLMDSLNGTVTADTSSINKFDAKTFPEVLVMLNRVAVASFVQPKLTLDHDGDDEHLPVRFVSLADKTFVMEWAMGAIQDVKSFRPESRGDVANVPTDENLLPEPVG